ncbi:MAG: cytochrome c biogenesis protein CcsA [Phycisphaeraceae bacterium]
MNPTLRKILTPLASLRLTVTLFALAMLLIFAGTLAQRFESNWTVVNTYFRCFVAWVPLQVFSPAHIPMPGILPLPGGYILGGLLLINLLSAHALRFKIVGRHGALAMGALGTSLAIFMLVAAGKFSNAQYLPLIFYSAPGFIVLAGASYLLYRQRTGIVLLHAGVVLLLVGELVTAVSAREGHMTIEEGSYANYAEDIRRVELAVIDPSNPGHDNVTVVPEALLRRGVGRDPIQDARLPFNISVDQWMDNSALLGLGMAPPALGRHNKATQGIGTSVLAQPRPPVTGTDREQPVDVPAAYISLSHDGKLLGTWLLSLFRDSQRQPVVVAGKTYEIVLRFERQYKPFTLKLIDFKHEKFTGTDTPRNFSSRVQLIDTRYNEDREVLIYMNHPLRYDGDTFYQAAFKPGDTATILQVVRNPGWLLPYTACVLVAIGMSIHFGVMLTGLVRRRVTANSKSPRIPAKLEDSHGRAYQSEIRNPTASTAAPAAKSEILVTIIPWCVLMLCVVALAAKLRPPTYEGDYDLRAFGTLPVSSQGRIKPLDTVARTNLFVISGRQEFERPVADLPDAMDAGHQRAPAIRWLADVMARSNDAAMYPVFRIDHPDVLALVDAAEGGSKHRFSWSELGPHLKKIDEQARLAMQVKSGGRNPYQRHLLELYSHLNSYVELMHLDSPYVVPPDAPDGEWLQFRTALADAQEHDASHPAAERFADIMRAYQAQNPAQFNQAVAAYHTYLSQRLPQQAAKARFEVFFNDFAPFYWGVVLYLVTFLLACGSFVCVGLGLPTAARTFGRSALLVLVLTFLLHSVGLAARMYITGRPPVTNLYSSAVFIGWFAVVLGLAIEWFYRNSLGAALTALIGAASLVIAHGLAAGDTMEMMQAVLDSNFWLATHVIAVTIGYAATFVAGFVGIVIIALGVASAVAPVDKRLIRNAASILYGVIAFALLFSFVGTVLGGIWADQSWGRFWGWDPKENGAVLIVLMTALILHARWAGLIRARGMAVLAVGGNIITAWSWFGTNMLGVGLHSYGFMDSAAFWLITFVTSQLLIMAVGVMPIAWGAGASAPTSRHVPVPVVRSPLPLGEG